MHQVADDLHHAIDGIGDELRNLDPAAAPHDAVLARCRDHLDILRRISGEIVDDLNPPPDGGNTMTNVDRAAEHMDSLDRLYAYASGNEPSNAERAQALADAGLLMPDLPEPDGPEESHTDAPTIIHTVEELEALDPDTVVWPARHYGPCTVGTITPDPFNPDWTPPLPAVVIRDGARVRSAREALGEA